MFEKIGPSDEGLENMTQTYSNNELVKSAEDIIIQAQKRMLKHDPFFRFRMSGIVLNQKLPSILHYLKLESYNNAGVNALIIYYERNEIETEGDED